MVCGYAVGDRGGYRYEAPLRRTAGHGDRPTVAVQIELDVVAGDPDLLVSVGEGSAWPTLTQADYTATTFGSERILVPASRPGPIRVTVASRWRGDGNATFVLRALSALAVDSVGQRAQNMDAMDSESYTCA